MLLMVDSASRYIIVSMHKLKSEDTILPQIRKNVSFIKLQFGRKIRVILAEPKEVCGTTPCKDPNGYGYLVKLHKKNKIISTRHFQISNLLFDPTTVNDKIGVKEVDF